MRTVVHFEDPESVLFGRPGKDGGQDARSGDGRMVFQAKFVASQSAAEVFKEAAQEASKIRRYRTPGNERFGQWGKVTQWRLVTNALLNPSDHKKRWEDEIVPLFAALSLDAYYWSQTDLDALVTEHPEIDRAYFSGKTRLFLSIPEARAAMAASDQFLERDQLVDFVGRHEELSEIVAFASSEQRFFVLHGPGGVGKSRLMLEGASEAAGEKPYQVLWGNTQSLQRSDDWFDAIIPERPTLLMLDEPSDPGFIRQLAEQLAGRAARWKVLITVRSPRDQILSQLRSPDLVRRFRREIEVRPLDLDESEALCLRLIESGPLAVRPSEYKTNASKKLATFYKGFPMWQALAVYLLERDDELANLPEEAGELARRYVSEIIQEQNGFPPRDVLTILRWLAALGTVDRNSSHILQLLKRKTSIESEEKVTELINSLVRRHALHQRGARDRLVELKPDVIRDHLLLTWLVAQTNSDHEPVTPSAEAKALVKEQTERLLSGDLDLELRQSIEALGRTEILQALSGTKVNLLGDVFRGVRARLADLQPQTRLDSLEVLGTVAPLRPGDSVGISRDLRTRVPYEELVDLIPKLASLLYAAATGTKSEADQTQLLHELYALTKLERKILGSDLIRNGRGTLDVFDKVLTGQPGYWANYLNSVAEFVNTLLQQRVHNASPEHDELLSSVLSKVLECERFSTEAENHIVTWTTVYVLPNHPFWETRVAISAMCRKLLESPDLATSLRYALWGALVTARSSLHRSLTHDESGLAKAALLEELEWASQAFDWNSIPLNELARARGLWKWHLDYDDDECFLDLARRLDQPYAGHPVVVEFRSALGQLSRRAARTEAWRAHAATARAYAEQDQLHAFFARAFSFLEATRQDAWSIGVLARIIGREAAESKFIAEYIEQGLSAPPSYSHNYFLDMAEGWVQAVRDVDSQAALPLLQRLISRVKPVESQTRLAVLVFRYSGTFDTPLTQEEVRWIQGQQTQFGEQGRHLEFIELLAQTVPHDTGRTLSVVDCLLDSLTEKDRLRGIACFAEALSHIFFEEKIKVDKATLRNWLFGRLVAEPDVGRLPGNGFYSVKQVFKRCGKIAVTDLVDLLRRRRIEHANKGSLTLRLNGTNDRLTQLVARVTQENALESAVRNGCSELIDFLIDTPTLGFLLKDLILDIDREGLVIPGLVRQRLASLLPATQVFSLSCFASAYPVGSSPWDAIAVAALAQTRDYSEDERRRIYSSLSEQSTSWVVTVGEIPQVYHDRAETARARLFCAERPEEAAFWRWKLERAEADIARAREEAREDRGE